MGFKGLKPILYGGREVWPLIEGGKGVAATNHASSGAWAAAGGIGTVSAVNADSYDAEGKIVPQRYQALTRQARHEELIRYAVDGAVEQVRRAYDISNGKGAININVLWEMGGAQQILEEVLERTRGLVTGVTCGAGMPYKLSEIAQRFNVNYLPIISSARAFRALWKRAYSKVSDLMAAVVYEDPWLAGEHTVQLDVGVKGKNFWVTPADRERGRSWAAQGFTEALRTPDDTVVFVAPSEREVIRRDQADCMGCLSHCGFSAWKDHDDFSTGRLADPRSFCIQKTLQDIAHGGDIEQNLMFAGHSAYRFKTDPFYSNNFTPSVKQLVDRILTGD